MKELTLRRLKNTLFSELYEKFLFHENFLPSEYHQILELAVLFINSKDEYIARLGYRLIVIYCNRTQDFIPLYEVSINLGLIPVAKFIEINHFTDKDPSFFVELNAAYSEIFHYRNLYHSQEQENLIGFYKENAERTISVIAPTSYGKTDLIITTLQQCRDKNICIITPTKSLLSQTKVRIMNERFDWINKIISHPEMYNSSDKNIVAVLTQERLLRLLKSQPDLYFDYVIVDEAHGLLSDNPRSTLLASAIIFLEKRNPNSVFKFLTPFLCDGTILQTKYTDFSIQSFNVSEYVKTERLYIYDTKEQTGLRLYDQFMDLFYPDNSIIKTLSDVAFIESTKATKNIIYLNKPTNIEEFARRLAKTLPLVESEAIEQACANIEDYLHPKYNLIYCLKHGVVYHHGSVPDTIRIYIEHLYSNIPELTYIVTSSTLLEGVNLPAERMYILDNKKGRGVLSPSNFKNLIGRVCRFSDIFGGTLPNLQKLEPEIYLVVGKYYSANANVNAFLRNSSNVDKQLKDDPKNVLLEKAELTADNQNEFIAAQEFIQNYEDGAISDYQQRHTTTKIGKSCFLNNVSEFDIFETEDELDCAVTPLIEKGELIDDAGVLLETIYLLFFIHLDEKIDQKILRFHNEKTRNFYKMFLGWKVENTSYNEMIGSFLRYWKSLTQSKIVHWSLSAVGEIPRVMVSKHCGLISVRKIFHSELVFPSFELKKNRTS